LVKQHVVVAADFFTVYSLWGRVLYVRFFVELSPRKVHVAGCTSNPDGAWVTQQARNVALGLDRRKQPLKFLIHDRDSKFCGPFDEVFATEGVDVIRTPIRAPRANAVAERWVRTVKEECLDWLLMAGRRHLGAVLRTYACHYNQARLHRGLDLGVPDAPDNRDEDLPRFGEIVRLDQLGGLIHEYHRAA
jgi:putative transposase